MARFYLTENGYKNVYFHIIANIRDYSTEDLTKVKETVAAIAGCTVEEVHESGKLPFILVLSIKNNFVNKLLALNQKDEDKLKKLSIDYFKIGSTTIHLECSRGIYVLKHFCYLILYVLVHYIALYIWIFKTCIIKLNVAILLSEKNTTVNS